MKEYINLIFITLCDYYKHNTVLVIIILWKFEWFSFQIGGENVTGKIRKMY